MKKFLAVLLITVFVLTGIGLAVEYFPPPGSGKGVIGGQSNERWGTGYFDTIDVNTITVNTTGTVPPGSISSTDIADITRSIPLQLVAAQLNSAGTITVIGNDGTTAPGLAAADGVGAIIWAASSEVASIGWSFQVPADYSSGLSFRLLVSSDNNTSYGSWGLAWMLYVNNPNVAFDATAYTQTTVLNTVTTPAASNIMLTFTADATAAADIAVGDTVTVWFGGGDGRTGSYTTEVKSVEARYTAVQ